MFTRQKRASNQTITVFILAIFILSLTFTLYVPEAQAAGSFTSATAPVFCFWRGTCRRKATY